MKRFRQTFIHLAPWWAAGALCGALPTVNTLYPAGGRPGTSFPLTVTGAVGKAAPSVWTDHPGITFKPGAKPNLYEVSLAADTPPGPHLVRFYNAEGPSLPKTFMVGAPTVNEATDTEPNDDAHATAQALAALPVTVNGRLDKAGDADASIDPLSAPDIRAAVARSSFELLIGFQLTQEQLQYNATR